MDLVETFFVGRCLYLRGKGVESNERKMFDAEAETRDKNLTENCVLESLLFLWKQFCHRQETEESTRRNFDRIPEESNR